VNAESMEVAEAARQTEWARPSFAAELFLGRFRQELLWPYPAQNPQQKKEGDELLAALEAFLKESVDADAIDRTGELPEKVVRGLADMGLFAMKIPKEYGGLGLSQVNYNRAVALVASHCGSTAVWLSAHQSIGVPQPLKLVGSAEQKAKWFPRFAKGAISAFALTEPDVGSDPARVTTTATPVEGGAYYLLNGEKLWCTNGLVADVIVVMARTPDREVRGRMRPQITAFIVETSTPGFEIVSRCQFMGLRAIQNGLIRFTNVKVPRENILLGEGQGLKLALMTLNTGRLTLPAASAAAAKTCVGITRRWASSRVQWGQAVGRHDAVAQKIASMAATAFAMEAVSGYASGLADADRADIRLEAAMAKLFCSEWCSQIVDDALQIRGGRGYETEASLEARGETGYPIERMLRDSRINRIIEGSSEIMRLFIIREALDRHMRVVGSLLAPRKASIGRLVGDVIRAGAFYAAWYPLRWLPHGLPGTYRSWGRLGRHLEWASRQSNRLARNLVHLMALNGPSLEKRQALLARAVDIGTDVFAVACACAYARHLAEAEGRSDALELADQFALLARRRVKAAFHALWFHDDREHHRFALRVLEGRYAWMEQGIMPIEEMRTAPAFSAPARPNAVDADAA
jgi:alkylation response protein AidB-like acyl-CoA dehydrogenase